MMAALAVGECEWELFAERLRFGEERARGLSTNAGCGLRKDLDLGLGIAQWRVAGAQRERLLELYGRWRLRDGGDEGVSLALVFGLEALKIEGDKWRHDSSTLLLALDSPLAADWLARFNLGLSRSRLSGQTTRLWAVGLEWRFAEPLSLVAETFGEQHGKPTQGLGLRWQPAEGWSFGLMGSRGRGQPGERALLLSAQWIY